MKKLRMQKPPSSVRAKILFLLIPLAVLLSLYPIQASSVELDITTGEFRVYREGIGGSDTVITNTDWVRDSITVAGNGSTRRVLEQFIDADSDKTKITRHALFIGAGSIDVDTIYKGSTTSDGEDSRTGILIFGENYGALIQDGSLEFGENFGGITESLATASGNYYIEEFGELGNLDDSGSFTSGSVSARTGIAGSSTGSLATLQLGSIPETGSDDISMKTRAWAPRRGSFFFASLDGSTSTTVQADTLSSGTISVDAFFENVEANSQFEVEDY